MFSPTRSAAALYFPPTARRIMLGGARWWENAGLRFWPHFAGVLLLEAEKQVYAVPGPREMASVRSRRRQPALRPVPTGFGRGRDL
jgi:hypothetical protein